MLKLKTLRSNSILKSSAGILLITILVKVLGYAEKLGLTGEMRWGRDF